MNNALDATWVTRIEADIAKKSDEKFVTEKINITNDLAKEAKAIALVAKSKADQPHVCIKEDIINEFIDWTKWLRRGIFILAGLAISAIGVWYAQQLSNERAIAAVEKSVVEQKESVKNIQKSVESLQLTQQSFQEDFGELQKNNTKNLEDTIKETIKSAIRENRHRDK